MKRDPQKINLHRRTCPAEGDRFRYVAAHGDEVEHEAIAMTRRQVGGRWGCDAMHEDGFVRYVSDWQVTLVLAKG